MSRQNQFDRILGTLHEAALGEVRWAVPASLINEAVRTNGNNLGILHGKLPPDVEVSFARSCYGSRPAGDRSTVSERTFFSRTTASARHVLCLTVS